MRINNKGITLIELIVIFMIAAILALVVVPNFTQYIGYSKQGVCEANRESFIRSFQVYRVNDTGNYSLEQAINGECPGILNDLNNLKCPSGGTFSVKDGGIVCSVHGGIGSSGGSSGGSDDILEAGDVIFGKVTLDSWTNLCDTTSPKPWGGTNVTMGTVYVFKGITYAVKWNDYLSNKKALEMENNPDGISWLQKFDSTKTIDSSSYLGASEWNPYLMNGTVFSEGGSTYVFLGENNTRYEALPYYGGYWLKLT